MNWGCFYRRGFLSLMLACAGWAMADSGPRVARPMAEDPVLETRLIAISEELRCLVCQNESLASSHAELALDLRDEVRGLIRQGKSDPEIKQYLVQRYGDFVLYRPAFKPTTYLLWLGPFALLLLAIGVLWRVLRGRRAIQAPIELSAQERQRAEQLLKDGL
ncbi:MAG: cytochrome c-type biogenesis protein CcmH [Alphaproteobacteria bacterium]|nr:cytochrome c-type biogenesis protein CcmH [Alphaproteobacteria bacterium]